jgi:hypothetical protein
MVFTVCVTSSELATALKGGLTKTLTAVERFGLINDAWATTLAGLTSLTDYLDLIELLRDETMSMCGLRSSLPATI